MLFIKVQESYNRNTELSQAEHSAPTHSISYLEHGKQKLEPRLRGK
jgi:hypothetical protein